MVAHQASLSIASPRKNTGVGYHFLLQGIFWTQTESESSVIGRWILCHFATRLNTPMEVMFYQSRQTENRKLNRLPYQKCSPKLRPGITGPIGVGLYGDYWKPVFRPTQDDPGRSLGNPCLQISTPTPPSNHQWLSAGGWLVHCPVWSFGCH